MQNFIQTVAMNYFQKITEENKLALNKPLNSDMVYYSELNEWYTNNAFRSLSLKLVLNKAIYYRVNSYEYHVGASHFMVACQQSDVKAYFDSKEQVKSICIDLCNDSFAEVCSILLGRQDDLENFLAGYFTYPEFYQFVGPLQKDGLSNKLQALSSEIVAGKAVVLNKEWFLDLIEKLVYREYGNYLSLQGIESVKASTRKEILRRLHIAVDFIKAECLQINDIHQVARHCCMSEYHFFRCFKQAFGLTPFQYITKEKMRIVALLVNTTNLSLAEIASVCNYPDAATLSKAYKRLFGHSPHLSRNMASITGYLSMH